VTVNKRNCDDLRRGFLYEMLNWYYFCAYFPNLAAKPSGSGGIFARAGFGTNAGFRLEPDSGTALLLTSSDLE